MADADDWWLTYVHDETAHNPQAWYYCAETLFGSAEYLFSGLQAGPAAKRLKEHKHMDSHYNSYGLLLGYALESILKGLWVAQGNRIAEDGRVSGIPGVNDHDLLRLATTVGVDLTAAEQGIVNRLAHFTRALGRYPVPKRAADMASQTINGRKIEPDFFSADEWQAAREITNRLLDRLRERMY